MGCGPQEEFRACADITIGGKAGEEPMTLEPEVPETTTTFSVPVIPTEVPSPGVVPVPEESYSPITALIVSLASFLAVFLVFSLLYIHFYQVGRQVKIWLKGDQTRLQNKTPPMPPPRTRRGLGRANIDRDSLDDESLA